MLTRRDTLAALGAPAAGGWTPLGATFPGRESIAALAFDAFALFDPRPLFSQAAAATGQPGFPARWFEKLFSYSWMRTAAGQYIPFPEVAAEALGYSLAAGGLSLSGAARAELLAGLWGMPAWPDVAAELAGFQAAGLRLAVLSNLSREMIDANLRRNGLDSLCMAQLSTDAVRAYKPAAKAYALAPRALGLPIRRIGFVAFASWDAIGASWFGFPTAWTNRLNQPAEGPAAPAPVAGRDLGAVSELLARSRA